MLWQTVARKFKANSSPSPLLLAPKVTGASPLKSQGQVPKSHRGESPKVTGESPKVTGESAAEPASVIAVLWMAIQNTLMCPRDTIGK